LEATSIQRIGTDDAMFWYMRTSRWHKGQEPSKKTLTGACEGMCALAGEFMSVIH
jgi:hypothetical protein